jgi:hypothetical protein
MNEQPDKGLLEISIFSVPAILPARFFFIVFKFFLLQGTNIALYIVDKGRNTFKVPKNRSLMNYPTIFVLLNLSMLRIYTNWFSNFVVNNNVIKGKKVLKIS